MYVIGRLLSVKGFWIHRGYGARLTHYQRFNFDPFDEHAQFVSLKLLQNKFGKLEAILDLCKKDTDHCNVYMWFEKYVVTIADVDGYEIMVILPRNPPKKAHKIPRLVRGDE